MFFPFGLGFFLLLFFHSIINVVIIFYDFDFKSPDFLGHGLKIVVILNSRKKVWY
jgi:hypothetical protein